MKNFLKIFLFVLLFFCGNIFASQKQSDNIANISATSLYNIDKNSLQNTIKAYIANHPELKALKIVESLSEDIYLEFYIQDDKALYSTIPNDFKNKHSSFKSLSKYENEEVGTIYAYFESKNLIDLSKEEKNWLDNNKITLSVDNRYAPMNFINNKGEMDGLSIDYIKLIQKKIGYPITLDDNSWPISLDNAMKHKSDGIINANATPKREEKLVFTEPYITVPMVLITTKRSKNYESLEQLDNKLILVKEKTVEASLLPNKYPKLKFKEVKTYKEALQLVSSNKAYGLFGHLAVLEYEINKYLIPNLKKNFISFNDVVTKQAIGIRKNAYILKEILDKAILSISKIEKKEINNKWMGGFSSQSNTFSKLEEKWIKENPQINIAVIDNYAPFDFRNSKGELVGFHSDLISLINKNLGTRIKLKAYANWNSAYIDAKKGLVHGIFSLSWSKDREDNYFIYSPIYHFTPYHLVVKNSNKETKFFSDLTNKSIAVEKGTIFKNIVLDKNPLSNIVLVNDTKSAYDSVNLGETIATISPNIKDDLFKKSKLKVVAEVFHKSSNLHIGVSKKYPVVASIISKSIDSLSAKQLANLRSKWFESKNKASLDLTLKEQKWLEQNPSITVGTLDGYPPYSYSSKEGLPQGIAVDFIKKLSRIAGINIVFEEERNWNKLFEKGKKSEVDVLTSVTPKKEREKWFLFTDPYVSISKYIITRKEDNSINKLSDIKGKTVAVNLAFTSSQELLKEFPSIKAYSVKNSKEAIQAVSSGKADAAISSLGITDHIMKKELINNIKFATSYRGETVLESFAISKNLPELKSILNKALASLERSEKLDILKTWISPDILEIDKEFSSSNNFLSLEEKMWVKQNSKVKVIKFFDEPPFTLNTDKKSGYIYELLEYLINSAGLEIEYIDGFETYGEMLDALQDSKVDILSTYPTSLDLGSQSKIVKSKSVLRTPFVIIGKSSENKIDKIEDLSSKRVAVVKGYAQDEYLNKFPNIKKVHVSNNQEGFEAIRTGKADFYVNNRANTEYILNKSFATDLKILFELSYKNFPPLSLSFAMNKDNEKLVSILTKSIEQIPYKKIKSIKDKWIINSSKNELKVQLNEEEKEFIKNNPKIRVHNEKSWPPFNYFEFGEAKGYSIDLMKLVAKNTGLDIEFVTGPTWDEFLDMMKKDELDVVLNIVKNKKREEYMLFTDPFIQATMGIAVHKNREDIESFKSILDKKVALENGFFYHDYFNQNHPNTNLEIVDNGIQTLQAVSLKKADATIGFVPVMKYISNKNFIPDLKYLTDTSSPIMKPMPLRFSTRKNTPELLSILQKGIASITIDEQKELNKRWLGDDKERVKKLNLTKEEESWLNKQDNISIGIQNDWAPLSYMNGSIPAGLGVDYLNLINKKIGGKINIIPNSFKENFENVKLGKVDALIDITPMKKREPYFWFTSEYANIPHYIISKKDVQESYSHVRELENKVVAVERGYAISKSLQEAASGIKLKFYENTEDAIDAVSHGKVDAYVGNRAVINHYLQKNFITNIKFHSKSTISKSLLAIGVNKDKKILRDILQKALLSVSKDEKTKIYEKYVSSNTDIKVKLNSKEEEWVKKDIAIKYVFDPDWAPFEWKNELNEHTGIIYDILRLVSERTGVKLEPVATDTWSEAVKLAEDKKIDMYGGLGENKERKKYMNFSKNILYKTPYVFVVHKDNKKDYFDTFNSLAKDEKIAVVDGYTIHGIMKEKQTSVNLETVPTTMDGFEKLNKKRIDILLVNASTAKYYINRKGFEDLKIATKTEYQLEIKSAIRKDWPVEVISIIDKGLESISEKELADIYLKWTKVLVEKKTDWSLLYKVAGGALVVLILVTYWNRRLKKAVDSKTNELKKLLSSFDENVIASKTDAKGIIKYASKAFCEISGYTQEELIGSPQNIVRHPEMPKELFKDLWTTIKSGNTWRGEVKNKKKNGGYYWVDVVIEPEFDEHNKIIGFSAIRQDITSKKEVEELSENLEIKVEERTSALKESQKRFLTLFDAAPDSIIIIKDGKIVDCNQKTLEIFGINNREEFIKIDFKELSPEYQDNGIKSDILAPQLIRRAITRGFNQFEWKHKRIDNNELFDAEVILATIRINDEINIYGVVRDISERKKAQQEIADQKQYIDSIMNSQSNIVISTDGEKLKTANKSFLNFFNVKDVDEFLNTKGNCICDTFDTEASSEFIQKMMGEEKWIEYVYNRPEKIHKTIIEKNGEKHIFSITSDRFEFAGEMLEVAVFTDISEIEAIRKNIETILSNIMLPVLITSKEDRVILYANEYASKQYECEVDTLIGSSIDEVYTRLNQRDEILQVMSKQGFVENLEEKYKTKTGKEFIGLLSVKPINYNNEDAYIGMVVDITKQKEIEEEIRQIHKHTQSSIEYASLIQHSLVPSNDLFRQYFDDYFTIWHPKDIVGGDIYLFEELRHEDECLLMVIDCTGHGVPGAFVTMLVKAIERQVAAIIASDSNLDVSPAWILKYFNQTMKKLLKQENDDAISNAGFDGAVLYYNKKEEIVKFAGAELPLFYTKDGEFKTIKGNRHSIGYKKSDANFEFKEHIIEAKEGMQFYLTSDGYIDQNGGEKGFPFGKKRFLNILDKYKDYSFADQQEVLLNELQEYQQDEERNDDITIVGIKIAKNNDSDKQDKGWGI